MNCQDIVTVKILRIPQYPEMMNTTLTKRTRPTHQVNKRGRRSEELKETY